MLLEPLLNTNWVYMWIPLILIVEISTTLKCCASLDFCCCGLFKSSNFSSACLISAAFLSTCHGEVVWLSWYLCPAYISGVVWTFDF